MFAPGSPIASGEINSACFAGSSRLIVASNPEKGDLGDDDPKTLRSGHLGTWNLNTMQFDHLSPYNEIAGTMMAVGPDHIVSFFKHPKIVELGTGKIIHRWPAIDSGAQSSCLLMDQANLPPPIALDPTNRRFAIAADREITVIEIV